MFVQTLFLVISIALTLFFFLYGFNHYYLLLTARRYQAPPLPPYPGLYKPHVAVHLPIYNEKYVVSRLVAACVSMAECYGTDWVRIVIIDDSDDETAGVVDDIVSCYRAKDIFIEALRRQSRTGYKAGALQAALDRTQEPFVAVFDADFTPPPDFLVRSIPYFEHDERLGIIQSRWTHLNRDYNILTRAISTGIDVHFLIDQAGRYASGCFQNFNGSGGILKTQALRQAGGWQADTLAEDLDASYRVQLQGFRVLYLRDLHSPGEVPPTVPSYKKQQGRWACGSLRTARKLLPSLLPNRQYGVKQRFQAFIHLTAYLVHPLMFFSFVLACLATFLRVDVFRIGSILATLQHSVISGTIETATYISPRYLFWSLAGLLIVLCTIAAWIPPLVALQIQPVPSPRKLSSIVVLFFLGFGVSLSNTIEAAKALLTDKDWAFKRTPKYAVQHSQEQWRDKGYQVSLDFVCLLELAFVVLGGLSIAYAIAHANIGILIILIPYTLAYALVFSLTVLQSR